VARAVVLVAAMALSGCTATAQNNAADNPSATQTKPIVVASFYPLAFVAERLLGDGARVVNLTPPGVEPHDLEVSPDQAATIEDAKLVLTMGQGLQPSVEDAARRRKSGVVSLLDRLDHLGVKIPKTLSSTRTDDLADPQHDPQHDAQRGVPSDPHVWLDPKSMQRVVLEVATALGKEFPKSVDTINIRSAELGAALADLNTRYQSGLAGCKGRLLVTTHAAFGRLAQRYGLIQESIVGVSPDAEPTANRLSELADRIVSNKVKTVFAEALIPKKVAETLARETGATVSILDPIESAPKQGDYFTAMTNNLAALRSGLNC
jgi:zinc transport system substrate-binding protein